MMPMIRKSRLFGVGAVLFILILILYLNNYLKSSFASYYKVERTSPKLVKGLGNLEPSNVQQRVGPGENGIPHVLKDDQLYDAKQLESDYGMNIACSDEISLDRSIPDTRLLECKHWDYPTDLPSTSVIIVFHNEGRSVLLRTIHSVINRSPPNLLKEILLVDDYSDKQNLKSDLDKYILRFNGKVRLVRNTKREGLIRTKSRGAQEAIGEVIVFIDAHCEVNKNWLPPLLAPIYKNKTVMTVPLIDVIDHETFEYRPVYEEGHHYQGIFEWGLIYREMEVLIRGTSTHTYNSEPNKSPTHAGGLLAINRDYFLSLGAYDPGLFVWGGENFDLSFKIWQCGGSIEWIPCSRVGHVYRKFVPYNAGKLNNERNGPLVTSNFKRIVETWFDEKYKKYFYIRQPLARFMDMGDISAQLELKEKLQCKSFEWFMENVAYDVFDLYPELPPNLHWGELRLGNTSFCLNAVDHTPGSWMALQNCHGFGFSQLIRLNTKGQLGVDDYCIDADLQEIKLVHCRLGTVDGPWQYDNTTHTLYHRVHRKCMTLGLKKSQIFLLPCEVNNTYQLWYFKQIEPRWWLL